MGKADTGRALAHALFDRSRVDQPVGLDIGKHRRGAHEMHRRSHGDVAMAGQDDLVAHPDARGMQPQDQRVGAVADAECIGDAEIFAQRLLELGHVVLQDERTAGQRIPQDLDIVFRVVENSVE